MGVEQSDPRAEPGNPIKSDDAATHQRRGRQSEGQAERTENGRYRDAARTRARPNINSANEAGTGTDTRRRRTSIETPRTGPGRDPRKLHGTTKPSEHGEQRRPAPRRRNTSKSRQKPHKVGNRRQPDDVEHHGRSQTPGTVHTATSRERENRSRRADQRDMQKV